MQNGKPPNKKARGFARDERDEKRLRDAGVKTVYRANKGETLDKVNMRQGEFLNVVDGLKALAGHRAIIAKEVARLHKMGATVIDAETGLESRTDGVEMLRRAMAPKGIPKEQAQEFQRQSVKTRLADGRMEPKRAERMWHDRRYNLAEFEEFTGWPRATCYVKWGRRFPKTAK